MTNRPLGYERVYLPLYEVADTPIHIQGDEICTVGLQKQMWVSRFIRINVINVNPLPADHDYCRF